jgi:hypothetical protein
VFRDNDGGTPGFFFGGKNMSAIGRQRVLGHLECENMEENIEVIARQTAQDLPMLEVRSLRWGAGVGWYVQKTLTLTPRQASRLAHLLRRFSSAGSVRTDRAKILPFRKRSR